MDLSVAFVYVGDAVQPNLNSLHLSLTIHEVRDSEPPLVHIIPVPTHALRTVATHINPPLPFSHLRRSKTYDSALT